MERTKAQARVLVAKIVRHWLIELIHSPRLGIGAHGSVKTKIFKERKKSLKKRGGLSFGVPLYCGISHR